MFSISSFIPERYDYNEQDIIDNINDTVEIIKIIKPIYILLTGIFLSIYCVLLYVDHKPEINGASSTGFLAFFHTIQIMLLGYDFEFIQETIKLSASPYAGIAFTYIALLFVLGPIYTFGFVLSFFENITSYIKCFAKRNQNLYVISDLNDKTLALANSIRQKNKKALIIFSNVFSDINEKEYDFVSDVKTMKALAFKKDVCDFRFRFHSKNAKIVYFILYEFHLRKSLDLLCMLTRTHINLRVKLQK